MKDDIKPDKEIAINDLKKSPLFAISRCGIELAHSNFWAWLIEIEIDGKHPFIEIFIKDFYKQGYEYKDTQREKNHRDLTIEFTEKDNRKCYVIENKIKSIPTQEQLDEYKEGITENIFFRGALTGINKSIEPTNGWIFLSYEEISKRIESILEKNKIIEDFQQKVIKQYIKDIRNIQVILKPKNEKVYAWKVEEELSKVRLDDIFLKQEGYRLKERIEDMIKAPKNCKSLKSKYGMPEVEFSFNNKKPTVTAVYKEMINDEEQWRIGIQIEGDQFRIYGGPSNKKEKPNHVDVFNKLKNAKWMEEYRNKKIRDKESSMIKDYCKYEGQQGGKYYAHVYQHWKFGKNPSMESIVKNVKMELEKLKSIIDKNDNLF